MQTPVSISIGAGNDAASTNAENRARAARQIMEADIRQIALSDVGFVEDSTYGLTIVRRLMFCGYPSEFLFTFDPDSDPVVTHPRALEDVKALTRMIKRAQSKFYERVAVTTADIFQIDPAHTTSRDIRELVTELLDNCKFLYLEFDGLKPKKDGGRKFKSPFVVPAFSRAIKSAVDFEIDDDKSLQWINHRTIQMTAVGLYHGLLRWTAGKYNRCNALLMPKVLIGKPISFQSTFFIEI